MKSVLYLIIALCSIFPLHSFGTEDSLRVFKGETGDAIPYYFKAVRITWDLFGALKDEIIKEQKNFEDYRESLLTSSEEVSKKLAVVDASMDVSKHLLNAAKHWLDLTNDNWIVSAVRKSDEATLMRMCVISNATSKITHHIGICQTFEHFIWDGERPRGLSLQLHGFAARFMLESNRERTFMITKPLPVMEGILAKAFEREYFSVSLERKHPWPSLLIHDGKGSKILYRDEPWLQNLVLHTRAIRLSSMASKLKDITSIIST